jgi:hypothetical protein
MQRLPHTSRRDEGRSRAVDRYERVEGGDKSEFESVLTALQQADIPLKFREHLNDRPAVWSGLRYALFARSNHAHDTEFEVQVLGRDAERAELAVRGVLDVTEDD